MITKELLHQIDSCLFQVSYCFSADFLLIDVETTKRRHKWHVLFIFVLPLIESFDTTTTALSHTICHGNQRQAKSIGFF